MKLLTRVLAGVIAGSFVIGIAGCGGGDDGGDGGGSSSVQEASSPEELGQLISETYIELIGEVRPIVESRPEPGQLQPRLEGIKSATSRRSWV